MLTHPDGSGLVERILSFSRFSRSSILDPGDPGAAWSMDQ